ncbi:MAG: hypothetical protein D6788_04460 [Planctomycetota bacterium]|nr:MAG: hypothetical protein D6788_04460 [Planctomycetota bacterium]
MLIHLAGLYLGAVLMTFLDVYNAKGFEWLVEGDWRALGAALADALSDPLDQHDRNPRRYQFLLFVVLSTVELFAWTLALILTPWGSRDEPIRRSFGHAVRSVYLCTAFVSLTIFITGAAQGTIPQVRRHFERNRYALSTPNPIVPRAARRNGISTVSGRPASFTPPVHPAHPSPQRFWFVEHSLFVETWTTCAAILVCLTMLLGAVGVDRPPEARPRPPTCDVCGYNLTGLPMEGNCPECGRAVAESIGPQARPGPPWCRRRRLGTLRAWWETSYEAVRHPTRFGYRLSLRPKGNDHRRFLAWHLAGVFVIAVGVVIDHDVRYLGRPLSTDTFAIASTAPTLATMLTLAALTLVLGTGLVHGVHHGVRVKRNLMPAAMQMACYLSPFLLAWLLCGIALAFPVSAWINSTGRVVLFSRVRITYSTFGIAILIIFHGIMLVIFNALVGRGTKAARFANR